MSDTTGRLRFCHPLLKSSSVVVNIVRLVFDELALGDRRKFVVVDQ